MKKVYIVFIFSLLFIITGCTNQTEDTQQVSTDISTEPIQSETSTEPIQSVTTTELVEDDQTTILNMIKEFKDSLINLGATVTVPELSIFTPLAYTDDSIISKDKVVESPSSTGIDLEWLDMSMMVLDFSELIVNSSYVLGENTLFSDISIDTSIWGWEITDTTSFILENREDVLYLRVISEYTIRTFYFSYDEFHMMKILRIDENGILYDKNVYIEDFVESKGLSIWQMSGNYEIYATYHVNDFETIVVLVYNTGEVFFHSGRYLIGDIVVTINPAGEDALSVDYDLANMDHFDGFDLDGNLYLQGEEVYSPIEVYAGVLYHGSEEYIIYARKIINADDDSLAIPEWDFNSDITYFDIKADIALALDSYTIEGLHYDYTMDPTELLELLKDELYFDYSVETE